MATATKPYRVKVCAFIMTHGIVTPKKTPAVPPVGLQPTRYTVTATPLPVNIKLHAPAILGYSYYEDKQTENIVTRAATLIQSTKKSDIAEKFLNYLKQFVEYKISRLNRYLSLVDLPHGYDRRERLEKQETLTVRTQMEWREHSRYITEKEYQIYPDQEKDPSRKLPSCIMIYCDTVNEDAMNIMNDTFNAPITTYFSENGAQITYTVNYDKESSTFKIDFGDTDVKDVSLDDIIFLIKNLILTVGPDGTTFEQIMLSIFDMTCDDLSFPNISAAGERPVLLSSVNSPIDPTLVYGTIQEGRALEIERETQTYWPSLSSRREPWRSYQLGVESVSPSPSRSTSPVLSHSRSPAAASPSNTHVVDLLNGVESFVNFNLLIECQPSLLPPSSQSVESTRAFVSPSVSVASTNSSGSSDYGPGWLSLDNGGGSHRTHTRSRRRRTKKVTRNNGRNSNRRRTKVRSKTKRRNTKLR